MKTNLSLPVSRPIAHRTRNDVLVSETQPWVLLVMR